MIYSIEQIATLLGAHRIGDVPSDIRWLLTDSRSLAFPDETLFFAIRTNQGDGHKYIPELTERGVRNFVVDHVPVDARTDINYLVVVSPLKALQRLAERHRDAMQVPTIGITGSNGKTIVKEWIYQLMSDSIRITRSPRSYNSQVGVPLSVWLMDENTELGVFEAGISQPGEMEALQAIVQPQIGILTHLGAAHQENFPTKKEKGWEKLKLFKDCEVVIYPMDERTANRCMDESAICCQRIGWSLTDSSAPMYISKIERQKDTTQIDYSYRATTRRCADVTINGSYQIHFVSNAAIQNSITCAATCLYLGLEPEILNKRMQSLEPIAMRLEVKEGQRGCTIINDSYNNDVQSLDIALDFMQRRPESLTKTRTLILSDIYQSGLNAEDLRDKLTAIISSRGIDRLIHIGVEDVKLSRMLEPLLDYSTFDSTESFLGSDAFAQLHDSVVLIKGARAFHFDLISDQLEQKVHETILEVNLDALVRNLNWYRQQMSPETKMICMVKADAYGAGAIEVARTLQDHRVDYLAVAVADEGVQLRRAGITQNIMIMNPEMTAFKAMFDYHLEPEVYSFRLLDALIKAAEREGITNWPIHIKLDTGMHRLGFDPVHDIELLLDRLAHQTAVIPRSVFSHFVGSDSDDFDDFSAEQYRLYTLGADKLQSAYRHHIMRHICNSAGIEHFHDRQMDACRLGLGLYGVNPRTNAMMHCVSTLKTTILQLRHVPKGDTIGYSRRGTLNHDSLIAAIPIGYADGLNRHLGNRHCYCLVNGQRAEYVGNICMDVAMIDVTGIDCAEGDKVEIFGENLPITVLSNAIDTIPYEIMTGIAGRVKRVYFRD